MLATGLSAKISTAAPAGDRQGIDRGDRQGVSIMTGASIITSKGSIKRNIDPGGRSGIENEPSP